MPPVFLIADRPPPPPAPAFSPSPLTPLPSKLALPVSMPDPEGAAPPRTSPPPTPLWRCGLVRCLRLEEDALLECRDVLRWW